MRVLALLLGLFLLAPHAAVASVARGSLDGNTFEISARVLTVHLKRPIVKNGRSQTATMTCGDRAGESFGRPIWVMQTDRSVRVASDRRHYAIRFPRDVSARANTCILAFPSGSADDLTVTMKPPAGSPSPTCRAVGRERVVARSEEALLLTIRASSDDPYAVPYRACQLPRGRSRLLDIGFGGSSQGQYQPMNFVLAGRWVAWTARGFDRDTPSTPDPLIRQDLRSRSKPTRTKPPASFAALGAITSIALAANGTAAWIFDARALSTGAATFSSILAARAGAQPTELDRTSKPTLTNPAVSTDGSTITWLRDGAPQSGRVAGTSERAPRVRCQASCTWRAP